MKTVFAGLLAITLAAQAQSTEPQEPEPYFLSDGNRPWGTVSRIVEPVYPKSALESGLSGYVDVEGVVTGWFTLTDVSYTPGTPEADVFVPSLRDVMPYWQFEPVPDNSCAPKDVRVTTRVWFEVKEGRPSISASRARLPQERGTRPEHMRIVKRLKPRYPRLMLQGNYIANAFAKMTIEPGGGVSKVDVKVFTNADAARPFTDATRDALIHWKFGSYDKGQRTACMTLVYRIEGN